jgi:hypothetical protein
MSRESFTRRREASNYPGYRLIRKSGFSETIKAFRFRAFDMVLQGRYAAYGFPMPGRSGRQGRLSHAGLPLATREELDATAAAAKIDGLRRFGPTFLNAYAC